MPVKATFEKEIMVMSLTSPISVAELVAGYEGILQDELFEPNMHAIWDLSELDLKVIPISDVRQLPRQLNQYMTRRGQGFKAALVTTRSLDFQLLRVYLGILKLIRGNIRYQLFKSVAEAREWVKS